MPPVEDAVARGLATLKAYAFASVDYPGAAWSFMGDTNATTTVGYFRLCRRVRPHAWVSVQR
jgi:hypothetical protein